MEFANRTGKNGQALRIWSEIRTLICPSNCSNRLTATVNVGLLLAIVLLGFAPLTGCGGASSQPGSRIEYPPSGSPPTPPTLPPPPPPTLNTAVLVNIGNFAAVPGDSGSTVDKILYFGLPIYSVALRSSKGDVRLLPSDLVPNERRFELSGLSSKFEPLTFGKVPQGDYSAVVLQIDNTEFSLISFIDPDGVLHSDFAAPQQSIEIINIPITIGSTPIAINLIPLANSVSFGDGNVVAVTPRFGVGIVSLPAEAANGGQVEGLVGRISSVGNSSFGIAVGNDFNCCFAGLWETFTFAVDSSTAFQGVTDLNELAVDATVEVDAVLDPSGTFLATKVKLENARANAVVVEGLTLSTSFAQLQMVVRDVHGPDYLSDLGYVHLPWPGKALTVEASASTQFRLERDHVDLNNLDFAASFDALNVAPGQNVRVVAPVGTAAENVTSIAADQLKLEPQSLDGIAGAVTAGSVSGQFSFPLNVTPESAFAQVTGHTSVVVTLQPSTAKYIFNLGDCVSCIAGQPVRVHGLLFFSGGQYRLVAEQLAEN